MASILSIVWVRAGWRWPASTFRSSKVLAVGLDVALGQRLRVHALQGGARDDLVIHIREVHHVAHVVAAVFQVAPHHVEHDRRHGVPDVRIRIDGRAAHVHLDFVRRERLEFFFFAGKGVYFPGCSLHKSSGEYDVSTRKMLAALGVQFAEVPEWTCCGSTPAHMMDHLLAQTLAARNLRQAALVGDDASWLLPFLFPAGEERRDRDPCERRLPSEVNAVLDSPYTGRVTVYGLPEYLMKYVGEGKIAAQVKTDLSQLKVVPTTAACSAAPAKLTGEKDIEQPMMMDLLLQAAGVDVKWWNYKTECCGASVGMPKMEIQRRLSGKIIEQALAAGADAIVVGCPLCHVNLDLKQLRSTSTSAPDYKVPILYLSQVLGLRVRPERRGCAAQQERGRPGAARQARHRRSGANQAEEERKAAEKAAKEAAKAAKAAAQPAAAGGRGAGSGSHERRRP